MRLIIHERTKRTMFGLWCVTLLVVLVAQPKAVAIAVKGQHERRRWSKLREWLASNRVPGEEIG